MAVIDDILSFSDPTLNVGGVLVEAIDIWSALDPGTRPTLDVHLGLTAVEFAAWGGPSTRVVNSVTYTTLGDALALQTVILVRYS